MAIAKGYQMQGQEVGVGEPVWFATGSLNVSFLKPVAIDSPVTLNAMIVDASEKKIVLECEVLSKGEECCRAEVIAVKVPNSWFAPNKG